MKKINILFIMPQLNRGGAEGVIVNILNSLNRNNFNVSLLLFEKKGDLISNIKNDVNIYQLNSKKVSIGVFKAVKEIYRLHPDIVFSGISNLNIYLSAFIPILKLILPNIKFLARQASILSLNNKQERAPKIYELLHKSIYKNYDLIICQSTYMQQDLISNYNFPKTKTTVINNPINIKKVCKNSLKEVEYPFSKEYINLIAVGNLRYEKRFDLLLRSFALLDNRYRLTIIGDGVKREELIELTKKLNITNKVKFLGYKSNPYPYIKESDLFVLTSEYEGFPNVVLEANLLGIFVVGFKSIGGVTEIINNKSSGLLVKFGDTKSLANTIKKIDISQINKKTISQTAIRRFSLSKIIKIYEKSIKGLIDEKNSDLQ